MPMLVVQKYPTYRMVVLGIAIAIGCILWWFLNRTRVGMMIRAGVDDRATLAASGVNVQRVFAITFADAAGSSAAVVAPALPIGSRIGALLGHVRLRHIVVLAAVLAYPWLVNPFFAFQIGGQALALGLIALSLTFLGGYGGMVSLAQMS